MDPEEKPFFPELNWSCQWERRIPVIDIEGYSGLGPHFQWCECCAGLLWREGWLWRCLRIRWGSYLFTLAEERLGVLLDQLKEVTAEREGSISFPVFTARLNVSHRYPAALKESSGIRPLCIISVFGYFLIFPGHSRVKSLNVTNFLWFMIATWLRIASCVDAA